MCTGDRSAQNSRQSCCRNSVTYWSVGRIAGGKFLLFLAFSLFCCAVFVGVCLPCAVCRYILDLMLPMLVENEIELLLCSEPHTCVFTSSHKSELMYYITYRIQYTKAPIVIPGLCFSSFLLLVSRKYSNMFEFVLD